MSTRCVAYTAGGNGPQCTRNAEVGSKYCWQHLNYTGVDATNTVPLITVYTAPEGKSHSPPSIQYVPSVQHTPVLVPGELKINSIIATYATPAYVPSEVKTRSPTSQRTVNLANTALPRGTVRTDHIPVNAQLDGLGDETDDPEYYIVDPRALEIWGHGPFQVQLALPDANDSLSVDFPEDRNYTLRAILSSCTNALLQPITEEYLLQILSENDDPDAAELIEDLLSELDAGQEVQYAQLSAGYVHPENFELISPGVYNLVLSE